MRDTDVTLFSPRRITRSILVHLQLIKSQQCRDPHSAPISTTNTSGVGVWDRGVDGSRAIIGATLDALVTLIPRGKVSWG